MSAPHRSARAQSRDRRIPRAVVVCSGTFAVLCSLAVTVMAVLNRASIYTLDEANVLEIVMPLTFAAIGAVISLRRSEHPIGWLFLFMAVVMGIGGVAAQYGRLAAVTQPTLPGAAWALWVYNWVEQLVYPSGAAAVTLLLLPDGLLPSRRWRPLVAIAAPVTALLVITAALSPGPLNGLNGAAHAPTLNNPAALNVLSAPAWFFAAEWIVATLVLLAAAASPLVKLRGRVGDEREQVRWILYAVLLSAVLEVVVTLGGTLFPSAPVIGGNGAAITYVALFGFGIALPVATLVAIMRYHLYDIDIIISRTLVYGSLAVLITGVYVGIAVGIGELVGSGGKPNLGLSILATAIVAVGFQPARAWLQRVANRLVYGKRATPYQVLSEFSSQVAGSYAADEVLPRMAGVLQEGAGAQSAAVWLRTGDELRVAAVHPETAEGESTGVAVDGELPSLPGVTRAVEVRHQGELLGALSVTKRRGESLTPVEEKLLSDLAHQAGLVLKNVGLTADLQRRLEELRASRQRLVSAQDAERRRLERNLHDGAQQHLVALKVKLGLAEMLAPRDPEKAKATLQQLKVDADEALDTLRDLARGIYPPLLAEKGLAVALESQARKATLPVTVEVESVGRYSQETEATVYFCVLEAMQNVQKYAGASHVTVRLGEIDGSLRFEVEDDGRGFDVEHAKKGSGLTNMTDRVDAVDGEVTVVSVAGRGTRVVGRLPLLDGSGGDSASPGAGGDAAHTGVRASARLDTLSAPPKLSV